MAAAVGRGVVGRGPVLALYKGLLREAYKLSHYNFRTYALRRIRDAFKENKDARDPEQVTAMIRFAEGNIEMIRRQAVIQHIYRSDKMIIEMQGKSG